MDRELVDAYWYVVITFDLLCTLLAKLFSVVVVVAFGVWGASQNCFLILLQLSVASVGYGVHVLPTLILSY